MASLVGLLSGSAFAITETALVLKGFAFTESKYLQISLNADEYPINALFEFPFSIPSIIFGSELESKSLTLIAVMFCRKDVSLLFLNIFPQFYIRKIN
jgi:hypothetical protein